MELGDFKAADYGDSAGYVCGSLTCEQCGVDVDLDIPFDSFRCVRCAEAFEASETARLDAIRDQD